METNRCQLSTILTAPDSNYIPHTFDVRPVVGLICDDVKRRTLAMVIMCYDNDADKLGAIGCYRVGNNEMRWCGER